MRRLHKYTSVCRYIGDAPRSGASPQHGGHSDARRVLFFSHAPLRRVLAPVTGARSERASRLSSLRVARPLASGVRWSSPLGLSTAGGLADHLGLDRGRPSSSCGRCIGATIVGPSQAAPYARWRAHVLRRACRRSVGSQQAASQIPSISIEARLSLVHEAMYAHSSASSGSAAPCARRCCSPCAPCRDRLSLRSGPSSLRAVALSAGPRATGPRAVGPRAIGPRAVGPRAIGPRATGPRASSLLARCLS